MINKVSTLLSERIGLKLNSSDDDKEVYTYSLEILFSLLLNLILLSITAFILNKGKELIVFIVFFCGLRTFAGGYHAKTHIECILLSLTIFLFLIFSGSYLKQNGEIILPVGIIFSIFMVFWLAPAQNANKPLSKSERKKYKIISRVLVLMLSFAAIQLYFYRDNTNYIYITAVLSMVIESISLIKS